LTTYPQRTPPPFPLLTQEKTMMDVEIDRMPWTRDLMTSEEMQQWVASREEAGLKIDIETCELGCWYAYDCDPYGARPDLPSRVNRSLQLRL
jgi:hypothetical protein